MNSIDGTGAKVFHLSSIPMEGGKSGSLGVSSTAHASTEGRGSLGPCALEVPRERWKGVASPAPAKRASSSASASALAL